MKIRKVHKWTRRRNTHQLRQALGHVVSRLRNEWITEPKIYSKIRKVDFVYGPNYCSNVVAVARLVRGK